MFPESELIELMEELNSLAYAAIGEDAGVYCPFNFAREAESQTLRIFDYPIWDSEEDNCDSIEEIRLVVKKKLRIFFNCVIDLSNFIS